MQRARLRTICGVAAILSLCITARAAAQNGGPYVTGHVGLSGGDGGPVTTAGGAVGYMTARRLGFELEVSVSPSLDLVGPSPAINFPTTRLFPTPSIDITGRLLTFQTNAVAALTTSGRLRAFVSGGGGIANLQEDLLTRYPDFIFPAFDLNNAVVLVPIPFDIVERHVSRSQSALCLNLGGIVDYAVTSRIAIGVDARYTHAFFSGDPLKNARAAARIRWGF